MQKTKQGISLIVLVITIIVMTILAGAIILTLNNSGIIDKASDAVEQSNLATVKELTQTAWAEAYATGERTEEGLKAAVDKVLEDNKVDRAKYLVEVTTSGVTVELKGTQKAKWVQQGLTVTNGDITIKVGEKINYTATGTDYTGDWKVLGASEYGELLIMSDSDVTTHRLGYKSTTTERLKESQNSWLNGATELDEVCEPYGKGEGATGARSVTVEDINKIVGYDPSTDYTNGEGQLYEYGNEVTYKYNGTTKPAYTGSNGKTGTLSKTHSNGFHFYNGVEFVHVNDLTTGTNGTTFATLKSDYYGYGLWNGDLGLSDEAELMIFGEYDTAMDGPSNYYWLASPCVITYTSDAWFGMRGVNGGGVDYYYLWDSYGYAYYQGLGVRAVVSLATKVNITGSSADGWKINM